MKTPEAILILGKLRDAYDRAEHGDFFYDYGQEVCEAAELGRRALIGLARDTAMPPKVIGRRTYCPSCSKQQKRGKGAPWYCERCGQLLWWRN